MLSSGAVGVKATKIKLLANGQSSSENPLLDTGMGVFYGQLSEIFRVLGGNTVWAGNDSPAVVTWQNNMLVVPINGKNGVLNGEKLVFRRATFVDDGKLYVCLESLAEAFSGSLRHLDDVLHLALPIGRLHDIHFAHESLVFGWSGNLKTTPLATGHSFCLEGTGWPTALRALSMERNLDGSLMVKVDVRGGNVTCARSEQGMKIEWKSNPHSLSGRRIALDAGHGGQQPGAIGPSGILEKDLSRQVVDRLAKLLREAQVEVIDVRLSDQTLSLAERVSRARQGGAHAFISVHFNAHERSEVSGTETYHFAENTQGRDLALLIHSELITTLKLRDRGIKQAAFYVLRAQPDVPAVVTEIGFVTNPAEELYLTKEATQQRAAQALWRAIARYFQA